MMGFWRILTGKQQHIHVGHGNPPIQWMAITLIFSILYLAVEMIFNAALTDVAGTGRSLEGDLRSVELLGRAAAGIGISLLVAGFWLRGKRIWVSSNDYRVPDHFDLGRTFKHFILIVMLVWPLVFFGLRVVVDTLIVSPTTPEQRKAAVMSQMFSRGVMVGSITLKGIDYSGSGSVSSDQKVFFSLLPAMTYAGTNFLEWMQLDIERVIRQLVNAEAEDRLNDYYSEYSNTITSLKRFYSEYVDQGISFTKTRDKKIKSLSSEAWNKIQFELHQGWYNYSAANAEYLKTIDNGSQSLRRFAQLGQRGTKDCAKRRPEKRESCVIALSYPVKKKFLKHLRRANLGVYYSDIAGTDWFDWLKKGKVTDDLDHYKEEAIRRTSDTFKANTNGYWPRIESETAFIHSLPSTERIKEELRSEYGITLPSYWRASQRNTLTKAITDHVIKEALKEWSHKVKLNGKDIPPSLTWKAFENHPSVRASIKEEMGARYVHTAKLTFDKAEFKRQVMAPNIQQTVAEYLKWINEDAAIFGPGGERETEGRLAVRAAFIPPISLALSLALILLNLILIPKNLYQLSYLTSNDGWGATVRSWLQSLVTWLVMISPITKLRTLQMVAYTLVALFMFTILFLIPTLLAENEFVAGSKAITAMLEEAGYHSPILSSAIKWLLDVQPVVHPMGSALDNITGVSSGFSVIEPILDSLDKSVLGEE